jgi:hypothetical protein
MLKKIKVLKKFVRVHIIEILFSVAGSIGGFLYWQFVGCISGTCIIKSVWYLSTLFGLVFGWLIGGLTEDIILKFRKSR